MNPEALSQLRPIHLPEPISAWPPAIGWWLLLALIVIILLSTVLIFFRNRHQRLAKKHALSAIKHAINAHNEHHNNRQLIGDISLLLKRVAMFYFSREQVASLSGKAWLDFLDDTGNTQFFSSSIGQQLAEATTNDRSKISDVELDEIVKFSTRWVKSL